MTDGGPLPSFLMDMDGVLVHEEQATPTRTILSRRPRPLGCRSWCSPTTPSTPSVTWPLGWPGRESSCPRANLDLGAGHRPVLDTQRPGGAAYAIGEAGLITALHGWDYTLTDRDPDYDVDPELFFPDTGQVPRPCRPKRSAPAVWSAARAWRRRCAARRPATTTPASSPAPPLASASACGAASRTQRGPGLSTTAPPPRRRWHWRTR